MTRKHRLIIPAVLAAMAAFTLGCNRPPAPSADNSRALEARIAKLEQDVKSTAAARDAAQQKYISTESRLRTEEARAAAAETARDDAQAALKVRTFERDAVQTQYEGFRKTIRELLGQADTAAAHPPASATPTESVSIPVPPRNGL
jgi:hypothetical protein